MSNNDRSVYRRSDCKWANKKDSTSKASSVHDTQKDAAKAAKKNLNNQGGGELKIMGRDGKIRSKDTISPVNYPFPPRDKEH